MNGRFASTLCALLVLIAGSPAAAASPQVEAAAVGAAALAPESFTAGWKPGAGMAGGARWPVGSQWRLGLEAEFVQFPPESRRADGLGGTRRVSAVTVPFAWRANSQAARTGFELVASVGYGHESIEPVSGGTAPGRRTRRDGVAWSGGAAVAYLLGSGTSLLVDLRTEGLSGDGESTRQVALRLGLRAAVPQR
jgi:hypothetical protein